MTLGIRHYKVMHWLHKSQVANIILTHTIASL